MVEKPRAAFHRAMWNDEPIVRIAVRDNALDIDHGRDLWQWPNMAAIWNFPRAYEGLVIEVNTTTNCERVALFQQRQRDGRTPDGGLPEPYDNVVSALSARDARG